MLSEPLIIRQFVKGSYGNSNVVTLNIGVLMWNTPVQIQQLGWPGLDYLPLLFNIPLSVDEQTHLKLSLTLQQLRI